MTLMESNYNDAEISYMAFLEALKTSVEEDGGSKLSGYFTLRTDFKEKHKKKMPGGEVKEIPAKYRMRFIPGKLLKNALKSWNNKNIG